MIIEQSARIVPKAWLYQHESGKCEVTLERWDTLMEGGWRETALGEVAHPDHEEN